MSSSGFKKLIKAQQETTRQLMSVEERAADDAKKAEINAKRVEGGRKAWETRQANATEQIVISTGKDEEENKQTTFLGKIAKLFQKDSQKGAADAEDDAKDDVKDSKMLGYLKSTAGFLGGIAKSGKEKVKAGFKGFSKFLFGGLAVAALAFLDNPKFKEIIKTLLDVIIPAVAYLYDEIIKPLALYIGGKLNDLFEDLKSYVDGDKGIGAVITENIGILSAIVLALAPSLIMTPLLGAVTLFGGAMKKTYLAQLAINAAAGAGGKAGILGTVKALGTTFLKFAGIAALIYAAVVGIFQGAKDAFAEFDKTGSIWEAVKTYLVSSLANAVGALLDPIKDGISWVYNAIGEALGIESLKNLSKDLDDIDIVEGIKKMLIFLGDFISDFFKKSIDKVKNIGSNILSGAKNLIGMGDDEKPNKINQKGSEGSDDPNKLYKNGRLVTDPEEKKQIRKEARETELALRARRREREKQKEAERLKNEKQFGASSAAMIDPRSLAGPMPSQNGNTQVVVKQGDITSSSPTTNNLVSGTTSIENIDRVFDKLTAIP